MKNSLSTILPKLSSELVEHNSRINTFLNPFSYLLARKNLELFDKFDHIYIDGIFLVKCLNLFYKTEVKRISFDFTSLANMVFDEAEAKNKTIYFVGSTQNEIEGFINKVIKRYNLNVLGYRNGYFSVDEKNKFIKEIIELQPELIICGMGTPYQEDLLLSLKNAGWKGTGYTCGGFFHQIASTENEKYYPEFFDRFNLRWLYRIYDEPKLVKRYFLYYPWFLLVFIYDVIQHKLSKD